MLTVILFFITPETFAFDWSQNLCAQQNAGKTLVNPKLVCCLNGWETQKYDCVQSTVSTLGPTVFDQFYDAIGGDPEKDADLDYPNRLFLIDSRGLPITGFYKEDGDRCLFSGKKPSEQMSLYHTAVIPPELEGSCRFLVRAALEVRCPANSTTSGNIRTVGIAGAPASPVVRCIGAETIVIHLDIRDLMEPEKASKSSMIRFRGSSTLDGPRSADDKSVGARLEAKHFSIGELISQKYGACPGGFKNENGICVFD